MPSLPTSLMVASSAIILMLGLLHLLYTFRGNKLHPRDETLIERMKEVSPVLTRETTMWRTWIGFNASHSCSAILFGVVYGYLALCHSEFLFGSVFLLAVGFVFLLGYVALGRIYWFSIPFCGIALSTLLYASAIALKSA